MRDFRLLLPTALLLSAPAHSDVLWPDALDVDLNYRNSARLEPDQSWDFRLGVGLESEPTYQGSDKSDTEVDPYFVGAYRAAWGNMFLSGGGLGYSRMLTDDFGIVLQLEAEDTREVEDDPRLAGLGDQDEELELEITARYLRGNWFAGGSVAVATGDKGVVWFLGGGYTWRIADDRLFVRIGADISGSTADNQRTDFGITQIQSDASGYPVYTPDGGLKSFGLNVNAEYQLNQRWYLYGQIDYENFLGDVADSPLVLDESNVEFGAGLFFRF
ncbi:MAG: MipA/OmpV family protein [Woeseiaceae bacterium]